MRTRKESCSSYSRVEVPFVIVKNVLLNFFNTYFNVLTCVSLGSDKDVLVTGGVAGAFQFLYDEVKVS